MSGVEIVAAAAAVSLLSSGVSAYEQVKTANEAADLQSKQIRDQQVQLRLQENQASIERMRKLESVLATQEVTLGERNISAGAGTANAFTISNMSHFYEDENADKLNYASKQMALARQRDLVFTQRRAQVFGAVTGFVREGAQTVMAAYSVPGKSLLDASAGDNLAKSGTDLGRAGGAQGAYGQKKQFNLNA